MIHGTQQFAWEHKATVRTKPRLSFDKDQSGFFFPRFRQPLSCHPLIESLGDDALSYLLTQSFYKYTNDIAIVETRVVNHAILEVLNNTLAINFTQEHKLNLYTIMVDEAYHAYVAYDAMLQIQEHTGIQPLPLPKTIEIEFAIDAVKQMLEPCYHGLFELIAVCLAENTLTHEIVGMLGQKETHPFFQQHIQNHLSDESRHAGIFFHLLTYIWRTMPEDYQYNIGCMLPEFLTLYLGLRVQTAFDKTVLVQMGLTPSQAEKAISDTYGNFQLPRHHPMLKNILSVLSKAGVLSTAILPKFQEKNWI